MAEPLPTSGRERGGASAPRVRRLALFGLFAMLALGAASAWQLYRQVLQQFTQDARRAVHILEEHAAKVIGGHLSSTQQIEWLMRDAGWEAARSDPSLHQRLRAIQSANPEVQSIWLFDADGNVQATSIAFPPPDTNFRDRDYFQAALQGEHEFIGNVLMGRLTLEHHFNLARRLTFADGRFAGVIVISLLPDYFQQFYGSIGLRPSVMLVREDGAVLARYPESGQDPTALRLSPDLMRRLQSTERNWFTGMAASDEGEHVYAFRKVSTLPLFVVYGSPMSDVTAEWLSLSLLYGVLAAPALLGFAIFGAAAYRHAQIADRSRLELHAANMLLEERVEQRTAELSDREARMRALALEVDHRAKNLLAAAQSIAAMTSGSSIQDYKQRIAGRLTALARAHSLLSESRWAGASLRRLAEEELAPYRGEDARRVHLDSADYLLAAPAAQSLSMILHELATNAAKYGAFAAPRGEVELSWSTNAAGQIVVVWRESGVPSLKPPSRRGFGTRLIETTCAHQLGGLARFDWSGGGLKVELTLPASVLVTPGGARLDGRDAAA